MEIVDCVKFGDVNNIERELVDLEDWCNRREITVSRRAMKSGTFRFMTGASWKLRRKEKLPGFAVYHRTRMVSLLRLCSQVQSKCVFREKQ